MDQSELAAEESPKLKIYFVAIVMGMLAVAPEAYAGCNGELKPCDMKDGSYHIELPEKIGDSPAPLVVFLHGVGGNGRSVMGNRRMVQPMLDRGYAVMAPTGSKRPGSRFSTSWSFYPTFTGMRDDHEFLPRAVKDAAQRFGTSQDKVLLSGFSAGAFMVTYLACKNPDSFFAYAPVAGGFWRPHPEECNGPIRLFQTHGWSDSTVPLEGRVLGGGRYIQGDIYETLEIWRAENKCGDMKPSETEVIGKFWVRKWEKCETKMSIQFALHKGGHTVPIGWSDVMLDWFENTVSKEN